MSRARQLAVSARWLQIAVLTFGVGFGILGYLAYRIYADQPPVPQAFVGPDASVAFTSDEILVGQRVFETRGLMEQGTLFGHGAYLGPDFTAEAMHRMDLAMQRYYGDKPETPARIRADFKTDRFDGTRVQLSSAQVAGHEDLLLGAQRRARLDGGARVRVVADHRGCRVHRVRDPPARLPRDPHGPRAR